MHLKELKAIKNRLKNYVENFSSYLGRSERRHWCWMYLCGLLSDGERKSIQPMAEKLPGGNEQALQQFVNQSPWPHEPLQLALVKYAQSTLSNLNPSVLVLDDTTLPKKGKHSVGVARQYCGALGKVANCQSIVSWHYVGKRDNHFPLLGELYLPKSWCEDNERLTEAGVPKRRQGFQKKWQIALDLLDVVKSTDLPYEALVFDAGYGEIREFLRKLDERDECFIAQIPESHGYWPLNVKLNNKQVLAGPRRRYPEIADKSKNALSAKQWRKQLEQQGKQWKTVRLPLASNKSTKVFALRVKEVITQAYYRPGPQRWLLIEQTKGGVYKYYVSNAPANTSISKMVNWAHERWKVEQGYQQLKEELGLDHFEGRSWRGLHHHMTLCFMAYIFLLLIKKTTSAFQAIHYL